VRTASDIRLAHEEGRVGIFFGFQNCSPIEDDIALVEVFRQLGVFVMQLTYNNQSLLASGCYEREDNGISRFGRQVIAEMNRVGMLIDMSHSAERSTLEAIELSSRPVIISHANPASFHAAKRNKSDAVLRGIAESGGLLGFSTYPFHLKGASDCSLESFCDMVARTADLMGVEHIGIGTDLCQAQPLSVLEWMRNGRWSKDKDRRRLQGQRQLAGALAVVPRQPRLPQHCPGPARPRLCRESRQHHGAELAALAGDRHHGTGLNPCTDSINNKKIAGSGGFMKNPTTCRPTARPWACLWHAISTGRCS
jgi:hypothetical protein